MTRATAVTFKLLSSCCSFHRTTWSCPVHTLWLGRDLIDVPKLFETQYSSLVISWATLKVINFSGLWRRTLVYESLFDFKTDWKQSTSAI